MVNPKQKYSNWLNNPNKIGADDNIILSKLINTYPFCSTSRILHLKGLQNTNNIHYNHTLKKTAAYSTDRKRLFYFLTEEQNKEVEPQSNKKEVKKELYNEKPEIEHELKIGKPIEFDKEETHSFNEWLKLSKIKPIRRSKVMKTDYRKK